MRRVNQKSMLRDPTKEIADISIIFKRDIALITSQIEAFTNLLAGANVSLSIIPLRVPFTRY